MTNLLVFCGRRKSGKSAAASIVMELDGRFKKVSFADPMKEDFCKLKKINLEDLHDNAKKEKYRWDMIDFGESKTAKDPFYWADKWAERVKNEEFVVSDDLRKISEAQRVIENRGIIYKVYASPEIRRARGAIYNSQIDENYTESEMDLSSYTFHVLTGGGSIFNNTNEINDLKGEVFSVLKRHFPDY